MNYIKLKEISQSRKDIIYNNIIISQQKSKYNFKS